MKNVFSFLLEKEGDLSATFETVLKYSIFGLVRKRASGKASDSYCFFDSSIPIYELGIQFGILRTNECCQRGS